MGCIEALKPEVLLARISFKEAREYIESHAPEVHHVQPGFKLFGEYLIGVPPLAIGIEDDNILFPFTKPCYGTFVLRLKDGAEVERFRSEVSAEMKRSLKGRGRKR